MSYVPMYQKMRELLKSSRIKQNELARRMGKNTSSISDMLTGKKRISIEEFFAFCEAVEVHPSKLFEDFESKREERLQELWNQRFSEVDRKDEGIHKVYRCTLREARENVGCSLEEAAHIMGISPNTLRAYEAGKHIPGWNIVWKMSELYQLPVDLMRFGVNEDQ